MTINSILDTIGNTPLIEMPSIAGSENVSIYAKLEGCNPSGSIKDRIAYKMITDAIKEKLLTTNKTIIEASSGNTGISIAMTGAILKYKVEIVMSEGASIERRKMIKAFGAKVVLTSKEKGTGGAIDRVKAKLKKNPKKYFYINQHNNPSNMKAHYEATGREIYQKMGQNIDYLVCCIGTCGTIMGVGSYLKKKIPGLKIIAVEPVLNQKIEGIRNLDEKNSPRNFDILDEKIIFKKIQVSQEKAFLNAQSIVKQSGVFVGQSSGAAYFAAKKIAKQEKKANIVTIFPDRGEKYLSTQLFN